MNKKPIGVGIVGLGFMGRTHLGAYAACANDPASARVLALCDPHMRPASAGNLVTAGGNDALLNSIPHEPSFDALLARPDIELVSICTPTDSHVKLARAAIAAGKHVLIEKPTALDPDEIEALGREATAAGVLAMPAHCMRFWPAWTWMANAVKSNQFGAARRASFRRMGARPSWSQAFYLDTARSGGAIIDLHIHDADFVRFAFGEPDGVEATGNRMHVEARYRYESGLVIEAEGAWMDDPAFAFMMVATIECERAIIDFRLGREPELFVIENGSQRAIVAGVDFPQGNGYEHEARALLTAISAGANTPPVSLSDAAQTQRLLNQELATLPHQ